MEDLMKKLIEKHEKEKKVRKITDYIIVTIVIAFWFLVLGAAVVNATELVHKFKSPSFSGIGTSSHYLTIENQEKSRRDKIASDIEAQLLAAKREEESTLLSKFIRNFESRVYSQLSKQLVDSLFDGTGSTYGSFVLEGNTITYEVLPCSDATTCTIGEDIVSMNIVDDFGSTTNIEIPVGAGTF